MLYRLGGFSACEHCAQRAVRRLENIMQASWTKLKSGAWGIKTRGGAPTPGEAVTVTKANGEQRTVTVARVIWRGEGVALCSIEGNDSSKRSDSGSSSNGRGARAWAPCGYPGCSSSYCDECDGKGRGA